MDFASLSHEVGFVGVGGCNCCCHSVYRYKCELNVNLGSLLIVRLRVFYSMFEFAEIVSDDDGFMSVFDLGVDLLQMLWYIS